MKLSALEYDWTAGQIWRGYESKGDWHLLLKRVFEGCVLVVTEWARGPLTLEEHLTDRPACARTCAAEVTSSEVIVFMMWLIYSLFNVDVFLMWSFKEKKKMKLICRNYLLYFYSDVRKWKTRTISQDLFFPCFCLLKSISNFVKNRSVFIVKQNKLFVTISVFSAFITCT